MASTPTGNAMECDLNEAEAVTIIRESSLRRDYHCATSPPLRIDAPRAGIRSRGISPLDRKRVPRDTVALARFLLGKIVMREIGRRLLTGRIVETEAYLRGRSGLSRVPRHDPAQSIAFPGGRPCLCVPVLRHLLHAQRIERSRQASAPAFCCAHSNRSRESSTCDAPAEWRVCATWRAGRGAWRLPSASISGTTDSTCAAAEACGSATTALRSDAIGESVRIGLTKAAEARLRYFVAGNGYLSGPRSLNDQAVTTCAAAVRLSNPARRSTHESDRRAVDDAARSSCWTGRSRPSSSGAAPTFATRSGRPNA